MILAFIAINTQHVLPAVTETWILLMLHSMAMSRTHQHSQGLFIETLMTAVC